MDGNLFVASSVKIEKRMLDTGNEQQVLHKDFVSFRAMYFVVHVCLYYSKFCRFSHSSSSSCVGSIFLHPIASHSCNSIHCITHTYTERE